MSKPVCRVCQGFGCEDCCFSRTGSSMETEVEPILSKRQKEVYEELKKGGFISKQHNHIILYRVDKNQVDIRPQTFKALKKSELITIEQAPSNIWRVKQ